MAPILCFPPEVRGQVYRAAALPETCSDKARTPPRNDPPKSQGRRGQSEDLQKMSESAGKGLIFIFGLFSKCLRVKPEEGEA